MPWPIHLIRGYSYVLHFDWENAIHKSATQGHIINLYNLDDSLSITKYEIKLN